MNDKCWREGCNEKRAENWVFCSYKCQELYRLARKRRRLMKTSLINRPSVSLTLLDSQRRPLRFTAKRLAMLQELQVEFPELPVFAEVNDNYVHVELSQIELWDMKVLFIRNSSLD